MLEIFRFLDLIKLSNKHILTLVLFTSVILFGNRHQLEILGLWSLSESYRLWFGILWLLVSMTLLSRIAMSVFAKIKEMLKRQSHFKKLQKRLKHLPPVEKEILAQYVNEKTRTKTIHFTDGNYKSLELDNILFVPFNKCEYELLTYNMHPWAWEYINKYPNSIKVEPDDI